MASDKWLVRERMPSVHKQQKDRQQKDRQQKGQVHQ